MSEDCQDCQEAVKHRRSKRAFARLQECRVQPGVQPEILYTVCTVPPARRADALNPTGIPGPRGGRGKRAWDTWTAKLLAWLKAECGLRYALFSAHPAGDRNPAVFHPHLNFLWVQRKGFGRMLDLDKLREAWAKIIGYDGEVVVHHQWAKTDAQIYHQVGYVLRSFPGWGWWRKKAVRWYGKQLPKVDVSDVWVCPHCGEEIDILGVVPRDAPEVLKFLSSSQETFARAPPG